MSHDLDPRGDVMLLLYDPNTSFAVWDKSAESEVLYKRKTRKKDKKWKKQASVVEFDELDQDIESVTKSTIKDDNIAKCAEGPEIPDTICSEQPPAEIQTLATQQVDNPRLRLRVSSRHLMLASPLFDRMFSNDWEEVLSGIVKVKGWDPEALLILMNIIHGRTRQVPRSIDLELLAKLAVLVDYYDCLEVVEAFSENWIEKLKGGIPNTYCRELVLWMVVSLVFRQSELFKSLTAVALEQSRGPFQTLGLPFPESVIDTIETRRQAAVDHTIVSLRRLLSDFAVGEEKCSFECSSILLGALTKEIHRKQLLYSETLGRLSLTEIAKTLQAIRSPIWSTFQYSYHSQHSCKLQPHIQPIITELDKYSAGLALEDLVPSSNQFDNTALAN